MCFGRIIENPVMKDTTVTGRMAISHGKYGFAQHSG
jgi:hypothetical protein